MRPASFVGYNAVLGKDQPQYLPLPAHVSDIREGVVTTCWQLSWGERLRLLVTGRLWLRQMTFGEPLQPQLPSATKPLLENAG